MDDDEMDLAEELARWSAALDGEPENWEAHLPEEY